MALSHDDDQISGSRQIVLILRLVLDRQHQLRHGELLDAGAHLEGRFVGLAGLKDVLDRWLERQRDDASPDEDDFP
jgi:hypothetical protein